MIHLIKSLFKGINKIKLLRVEILQSKQIYLTTIVNTSVSCHVLWVNNRTCVMTSFTETHDLKLVFLIIFCSCMKTFR